MVLGYSTPTVPLSTQANLMPGVTLRRTYIPSRKSKSTVGILLHASEAGDKRQPVRPVGLYENVTLNLRFTLQFL